jgi:hypothetical protein
VAIKRQLGLTEPEYWARAATLFPAGARVVRQASPGSSGA